MKKILFMIAMCLTAGIAGAQTKDVVLEKKIIRAVQPVTQKLKYVLQTGENIKQESGVYFTDKSACNGSACCDGTRYCTHLAIYYDKQKNCRRDFGKEGLGFVDASRSGGNGGNYYNMVHKNICYVISTHKKKDAEALARAIRSKI
ncbi:hypothetical protein [Neisseria montereyensis]|uniref:DUF4189 domain-containing protein n=1 Tax=Neisseria montereyensis TaxID=2973938 RepID=A0ABT2FDR5_9NEIS|nr:hypothetical protein [Neisseria montereyensis]MCS4534366.1 hypothetical protein [Neisseria montereyensis]